MEQISPEEAAINAHLRSLNVRPQGGGFQSLPQVAAPPQQKQASGMQGFIDQLMSYIGGAGKKTMSSVMPATLNEAPKQPGVNVFNAASQMKGRQNIDQQIQNQILMQQQNQLRLKAQQEQ